MTILQIAVKLFHNNYYGRDEESNVNY